MRILLGITGGIAAYKAANLVRKLTEEGHNVQVLPTKNALEFIGKSTLEALSGNAIDSELYSDVQNVRHIKYGQEAELIIVAPATANFLAKLAHGIADDLLMNAILASNAEVVICPAMHTEMWLNPATRANVKTLQERGIRVMEPASGRLTGSDSGPGRLPEPEDIIGFALAREGFFTGKSVTVTAGGTREAIDEVRYIGNSSSGRMGIELATAFRNAGAKVTLVACNIDRELPTGVEVLRASSIADLELAMDRASDVLVMAAAVSDFQLDKPHRGKLHRGEKLVLELLPTKDLLAGYAANHQESYCVGFALVENNADVVKIATEKMWDKGVDAVVGNTVSTLGSVDAEVNLVTKSDVLHKSGTKSEIAQWLVLELQEILSNT